MANNLGKTLKGIATIIAIAGMAVSCVLGIMLCTVSAAVGILVIIAGCLMSWLGTMLLYAFGELVDRVHDSYRQIQNIKDSDVRR